MFVVFASGRTNDCPLVIHVPRTTRKGKRELRDIWTGARMLDLARASGGQSRRTGAGTWSWATRRRPQPRRHSAQHKMPRRQGCLSNVIVVGVSCQMQGAHVTNNSNNLDSLPCEEKPIRSRLNSGDGKHDDGTASGNRLLQLRTVVDDLSSSGKTSSCPQQALAGSNGEPNKHPTYQAEQLMYIMMRPRPTIFLARRHPVHDSQPASQPASQYWQWVLGDE
jgi:hypothetical protein